MDCNASPFDQSLGSWDLSKLTGLTDFLKNGKRSRSNYHNTLRGGCTLDTVESNSPPNLMDYFDSKKYPNNPSAVQLLIPAINILTWSIITNMVFSTLGQAKIFNNIKTLWTFCLWYSY